LRSFKSSRNPRVKKETVVQLGETPLIPHRCLAAAHKEYILIHTVEIKYPDAGIPAGHADR
jgi:hypothetical protein